jgi:hypothetical protein
MKRILSFTLALVMAIGLVAIPASAADFKDARTSNTKRRRCRRCCGHINGFEDGSFSQGQSDS